LAARGLTIGIVAYNALDKLRACLDSVAAQVLARPLQVVVVDNASAEPVADTLRADYPWVTLVASARNLGFAGGSNLALAQAQHPLLLLLNPDTVLPAPDTLERLAARFEARPGMGHRLVDNGRRLHWHGHAGARRSRTAHRWSVAVPRPV